MKRIALIFGFLLWISPYCLEAQDFEQLLTAGLEDASRLTEGYLDPLMESMGVGMTSGWYNTAATHNSLGFDFTVTSGWVIVPDDKNFYSPNSLDLINTEQINGDKAPTLFGPEGETTRPRYRVTDPDTHEQVIFDGPEGIDLKEEVNKLIGVDKALLPVPVYHLGIGIPGQSDIKLRYTPRIKLDDDGTSIQLLGGAFQHDIKQHIPGLRTLPFDLSVLVGYTRIKAVYDMGNDATTSLNSVTTEDGRSTMLINSWTFQALISKEISVITFYGGLGYNKAGAEVDMTGTYKYQYAGFTKTVTDPLDMTFRTSGTRFTAGMRLKLAVFTLHGDYTFQEYQTFSVGIGIAVN